MNDARRAVAWAWMAVVAIPVSAQDVAADRREFLAHVAERAQVAFELDGERFGGSPAALSDATANEIARAIRSEAWADREAATGRLLELGWPGLAAVEPLAGSDPEVTERLAMVRRELESRRDGLHGLLDAVVPDWGRWEALPDGSIRISSGEPRATRPPEDLRARLQNLTIGELDLDQADAASAFSFLEERGIDVLVERTIAGDVDLRLSLKLNGISALDTIDLLASIGQVSWSVQGGAVVIRSRGEPEGDPIAIDHALRAGTDSERLVRWLRASIAPGEWVDRRMSIEPDYLLVDHRPEVQVRVRRAIRGLGAARR